ncbi:MAG: putative AdoMet-dependent methyltransferase [Arcobacteraceae bacterium]
MNNKKDYFVHKAKSYEENSKRVSNVQNIADGILKEVSYTKDMHILDFGSGTGLLTQEIAPFVGNITAIDMSTAMNEVLNSKKDTFPCPLKVYKRDITKEDYSDILDNVDGIISSMTIHHIEDIEDLFKKFYDLLNDNGTICLADLEKEDGSFHSEDTGVFHFGFDKEEFLEIAKKAGFEDLKIETISVASKPHGEFPIFLLTGRKKKN